MAPVEGSGSAPACINLVSSFKIFQFLIPVNSGKIITFKCYDV